MDSALSPLSWTLYYQGKSMEELRQALLCTTLDLETTRLAAQEEIRRMEDEVIQLKDHLNKVSTERDEAKEKCQSLLMDKLFLLLQLQQQNQNTHSGVSSIEDEARRGGDSNTGISSDCEESIVSSPLVDSFAPPPQMLEVIPQKPLPEKGKLLQAVMKAGPLLQTLLLAGPLPQWRHPPPPLDSFEIPPVAISSPLQLPQPHFLSHNSNGNNNSSCGPCGSLSFNSKKRSLLVYDIEGSDFSTNSKHQRVVLH